MKFLHIPAFILFFIFAGCKSIHQLKNPSPEEKKKQGLVVAGLVVLDPAANEFFSEDKGSIRFISPSETTFAQIISVNEKKKDIQIKLVNREKPKKKSREGMKLYYESNNLFINPYLVFQNAEDHFLTLYETAYYIPCGPSCSRRNILTLSPLAAQKVFTAKSRPGQIVFAGIFVIRETLLKKGVMGVGEKKGVELVEGLDIIKSRKNMELKNMFFGEEEQSLKGAEIHFLRKFTAVQQEGYWKTTAIKKLESLEKK